MKLMPQNAAAPPPASTTTLARIMTNFVSTRFFLAMVLPHWGGTAAGCAALDVAAGVALGARPINTSGSGRQASIEGSAARRKSSKIGWASDASQVTGSPVAPVTVSSILV